MVVKRIILILIVITLMLPAFVQSAPKVNLVQKENQVDVLINGKLFTSYIYGDNLPKSFLAPVCTPSGIEVTRRHPLVDLEGGSDDHEHHVGIFFASDRVNGTERFWNSTGTSPQIKLMKVTDMVSGDKGKLSVESNWIDKKGTAVLKEERTMIFMPTDNPSEYAIDFSMDLTALTDKVVFEDIEEGVFAIRLADCLREQRGKVDAGVMPGKPLPKESVKGTGRYFSSNGDETARHVWGKRARWLALQGVRKDKVVGVAILNHPESINYPTYWHARHYVLFSANPLGQGDFQRQDDYKKNDPVYLNFTLKKGQKAHFRFLVIAFEGVRTQDQIEKRFKEFAR